MAKAWNRFLVGGKRKKGNEGGKKRTRRHARTVLFGKGGVDDGIHTRGGECVYARLEGRVVGSYLVGSAALSTSLSEGWV